MLLVREKDPDRFKAVMLHELAHVANRDVGITYATIAMWRVFLIAVLLPGAVDYTYGVLIDGTPAAWGETTLSKSRLVLEIAVVVLAYLTRSDILRIREIYADRTAQTNDAMLDQQRPAEVAVLSPWYKAASGFFEVWRTHPPWTVRYAALRDPSVLFRPGLSALFITGFAADIAANEWTGSPSDGWQRSARALCIAGLIVGVVGTAVWRAVAATVVRRTAVPSGLLIGLWPGLGLAAAELLRNAYETSRWVPEHPEALLLLVAATAVVTAWMSQYAELRIRTFRHADIRHAMVFGLIAPGLVLAMILVWWDSADLIHGRLFDYGRLLADLQLPQHPPWQVAPLPVLLFLPGISPTFWSFIWALPLLWLIPLTLWSRPLPVGPAPWVTRAAPGIELADTVRPRLIRPTTIGIVGGVLVCGVLAATRWYLKPVRAHGDYLVVSAELVWIILVVVGTMAVVSAVAATMSQGRYPLVQGLLAAGIAGVLGLAAAWTQNAVDGCLGPFNTGNFQQCRFDAAFPTEGFRIALGYGLGSGLLVALLVAAVVQVLTSHRYHKPAKPSSDEPRVLHLAWRRAATGMVVLLAGGSIAVDTVYETAKSAPPISDASSAAWLAKQPPPSPRTQYLQVMAWGYYGGGDLVSLYGNVYQAFDDAAKALADTSDADVPAVWNKTVPAACTMVHDADRRSRSYFPVPVAPGQGVWAKAVDRLDLASAACDKMKDADAILPFWAADDDLYDAYVDATALAGWALSLTSAPTTGPEPAKQPLLLGTPQTTTAGGVAYRLNVGDYTVRQDHTATIQVETCRNQGPPGARTVVSWAPWYLVLADGTKATPLKQQSRNGLDGPLYPDGNGETLTNGSCVSGLIAFGIPAGATSQAVEVVSEEPDLAWRVPQPG